MRRARRKPRLEAIDCAALRTEDGRVFAVPQPLRHDALFRWHDLSIDDRRNSVQGFLTSTGRFVDRLEAYGIADRAGQIVRDVAGQGLFTEHLW